MNELNYGSLPACKRLAEVLAKKGRVIETEFCHFYNGFHWEIVSFKPNIKDRRILGVGWCPAPSMAEVWRELPEEIYLGVKTGYHLELVKMGETNRCTYRAITCSTLGYSAENINPTDALIELWIWVLEREDKP